MGYVAGRAEQIAGFLVAESVGAAAIGQGPSSAMDFDLRWPNGDRDGACLMLAGGRRSCHRPQAQVVRSNAERRLMLRRRRASGRPRSGMSEHRSVSSGQEVPILLAREHGMNDHLLTTLEDQDHGLE